MSNPTFMGIPATNKRITMNGMEIYRVAGGKIAEGWSAWDTAGMMQKMGVLPAPGAAAGAL